MNHGIKIGDIPREENGKVTIGSFIVLCNDNGIWKFSSEVHAGKLKGMGMRTEMEGDKKRRGSLDMDNKLERDDYFS